MKYLSILGLSALIACNQPSTDTPATTSANLQVGVYKGSITIADGKDLPIVFSYSENADPVFTFTNAQEVIEAKEFEKKGDSLILDMPVFNTGFRALLTDSGMEGVFVKYDAEDYRLPFRAALVESAARFDVVEDPCCSIIKKWKVTFRPEGENPSDAIGEFIQDGNQVTGTFMTETGDYRFLEGVLNGNQLQMAAFDGMHLYVIEAEVQSPDMMVGTIYSGKTRKDNWIAVRDDDFELSDPEKLTYLKEGYDKIEFELPLTADSTLVFNQEHFKDKVVILQILGSWCPNCMDESTFLQKMYEYYQDQGLVVIGLAFERRKDQKKGFKAIEKMGTDLNLTYPIGFAGSTSVEDREKMLPQLNKIMSFPTSIYIDKKGNVRKIHTGFNGPGTSVYQEFTMETNDFIMELLRE